MTISRKAFLGGAAGGTVLLLLEACGGGGSYDDTQQPAPRGGCSASAITGNHGHILAVARADLDSMTSRTYDITGSANHPHSVTFTPAQLQTLKNGQSVTVTSSNNAGHDHSVTASCV